MYIPPAFAVDDLDRVSTLVEQVGAADIVTFDGSQLTSTLAPVIWERTAGGYGRLLAHIAAANSQWRRTRTDVPALAIVHGPQAYVSPSWYQSKREHGRVVPTWNYLSVHFTGPVTFHADVEWLRDIVTRLTEKFEAPRADRWHVGDAPPRYIDAQLRGIVGIEMAITRVEAKAKLNQNRSAADRTGVIAGLRAQSDAIGAQVADAMQSTLQQ
jgi:transcriptional regulator